MDLRLGLLSFTNCVTLDKLTSLNILLLVKWLDYLYIQSILPVELYLPQKVIMRMKLNNMLKVHSIMPYICSIIKITTNIIIAVCVSPITVSNLSRRME